MATALPFACWLTLRRRPNQSDTDLHSLILTIKMSSPFSKLPILALILLNRVESEVDLGPFNLEVLMGRAFQDSLPFIYTTVSHPNIILAQPVRSRSLPDDSPLMPLAGC